MDEDEKTIDEMPTVMLDRAKDLLLESGNCAQTSFAILNEEHPISRYSVARRDVWCGNWIAYGVRTCLWTRRHVGLERVHRFSTICAAIL
jgi:hypothetical protein